MRSSTNTYDPAKALCQKCTDATHFLFKPGHGIKFDLAHVEREKENCRFCQFLSQVATIARPATITEESLTLQSHNHTLFPIEVFGSYYQLHHSKVTTTINIERAYFSAIVRWLGACDEHKHFNEGIPSARLEKLRIWLIDVDALCLVTAAPGSKYAALSYVWYVSASVQSFVLVMVRSLL
jgi:hypothetical protein